MEIIFQVRVKNKESVLLELYLKMVDLLIYDEPTSNLDHTTAKEIESILLNIDKTCFMITHKLDKELLSKFDEILVLKRWFFKRSRKLSTISR